MSAKFAFGLVAAALVGIAGIGSLAAYRYISSTAAAHSADGDREESSDGCCGSQAISEVKEPKEPQTPGCPMVGEQAAAHACPAASGHVNAPTEVGSAYACPMHPQVAAGKPGKCPTCGMDLVRKAEEAGGAPAPVEHGESSRRKTPHGH